MKVFLISCTPSGWTRMEDEHHFMSGVALGERSGEQGWVSAHLWGSGLCRGSCVSEVRHREWDESWRVSFRTGCCCQVWFLELRRGASDFTVEPSISPWPSLVGLVCRRCSLLPWLHCCFGMWVPLTQLWSWHWGLGHESEKKHLVLTSP